METGDFTYHATSQMTSQTTNGKQTDTTMTEDDGKRSRTFLDPATKLKIVELEEKGIKTLSQLALEYNVGESSIRKWKHQLDKIRLLNSSNENSSNKKKTFKDSTFVDTDRALFAWYQEQKTLNNPVSYEILSEKARELNKFKDANFKASHGFIARFCKRHDIKLSTHVRKPKLDDKKDAHLTTSQTSSGKIATGNSLPAIVTKCLAKSTVKSSVKASVLPFIKAIDEIIRNENLTDRQVFSMHEAGFLWKNLPVKFMSDKTIGDFKLNVERVSIALCSNSTGDFKFPLMVVNKPKAQLTGLDKSLNMTNLPVDYFQHYKAWLTQQTFYNWFYQKFIPRVEDYLASMNLEKKALLLIENCSAHSVELASPNGLIRCQFIPSTVAKLLKPMDHSPIAWLKRQYRVKMIKYFVIENEGKELHVGVQEFLKSFHINKCLNILASLWKDMPASLLSACAWNNLTIIVSDYKLDIVDLCESSLLAEKKHIAELLNLNENDINDWLDKDKYVPGHSSISEFEMLKESSEAPAAASQCDADQENMCVVGVVEQGPTDLQAYNGVKCALDWLAIKAKNPQPEQFVWLQSVLNSISEQIIEQKQQPIQLDLNDLAYLF